MILKEHELLQIDEKFISQLREQDPDALAGLSIKLVTDLKEVLERLNQNPSNSSRPSGSLAPWDKGGADEDDELNIDEKEALQSKTNTDKEKPSDTGDTKDDGPASEKPKGTNESRKPGRQPDSQGFGRIQKLANTDTKHHHCEYCSACNTDMSSIEKA